MPIPVGNTEAEKAKIKKWLKDRNKYPSGFCNENGIPKQSVGHEGSQPTDWQGTPMMTCPDWMNCPCDCHYRLDVMFELGGIERHEVANPKYVRPVSDFVIPPPSFASPLGDPNDPTGTQHDPFAPAGPTATPLAQRRTPLGYAGRGTLEAQVWDCMNTHVEVIKLGVAMTTLMTSEWIAEHYEVPTPSRGAIQAVWKRWEQLGYCIVGTKPVSFLGFTSAGTWEQLERLKADAKRQKKSAQAADKRGYIRAKR